MKTRKIARAKAKAENRKKALEMLQDEIDKKEEGGEDGKEEGKKASADLEKGGVKEGRASKKLVSGSAKSSNNHVASRSDNPAVTFDPAEFEAEMDEKNKKEEWKKKALATTDRLAPAKTSTKTIS